MWRQTQHRVRKEKKKKRKEEKNRRRREEKNRKEERRKKRKKRRGEERTKSVGKKKKTNKHTLHRVRVTKESSRGKGDSKDQNFQNMNQQNNTAQTQTRDVRWQHVQELFYCVVLIWLWFLKSLHDDTTT